MNYVNAVIKDGKLTTDDKKLDSTNVHTTRQKHGGTTFVLHSFSKPANTGVKTPAKWSSDDSKDINVAFIEPQTGSKPASRKAGIEKLKHLRQLRKSSNPKTEQPARRQISSSTIALRPLVPATNVAGIQNSRQIIIPIDDWKVIPTPLDLTRDETHAVRSYLDILAMRIYYWERIHVITHNPTRVPETIQVVIEEPITLKVAVSIGILSEFVRHRGASLDTTSLAYHSAKLCSLVNQILNEPMTTSRQIIMMHAVMTLSLVNIMAGQYDQWHIHMRGLRSLLRSSPSVPPSVKWLAYKSDIIGSTELVMAPYMQIERQYPSISHQVDKRTRAEVTATVSRCLSLFCNESFVQMIVRNALLSKRLNIGPPADPDVLMEEVYVLAYELMRYPVPMEALHQSSSSQNDEATAGGLQELSCFVEASTFPQCILSTIRLALILHGKILNPDNIDYQDEHPILKERYGFFMQKTAEEVRQASRRAHEHAKENPSTKSYEAAVIEAARPALIWLCLHSHSSSKILRMEIPGYRSLLVEIIGSDESVVDSLPQSDFDFCVLFFIAGIGAHDPALRATTKEIIRG